jgi:ABC-type dipeptide/oligopeptide/nickel transport system permease subunit
MTAETSRTAWAASQTSGWKKAYPVQILFGLMRHPVGGIGASVCLLLFVGAIFAPVLAPYDPSDQFSGHRLEGPSLDYFFGTDEFSRDIFSRLLYGLRSSLLIGFGAVILGGVVGSCVGLVAGFVGGVVDLVIVRLVDALLAFPAIVGAIAIVTALGPSKESVAIALAVFNFPGFVRLARASALVERERDYVLAVTSVGATRTRILLRHVTPNALTPLTVQFAFAVSFAILAEAGLSFLGLDIRPPEPSIGGTLNASRSYMSQSAGYVIFPAVTIAVLLTALNFVADGLNDVLDPRRRRR